MEHARSSKLRPLVFKAQGCERATAPTAPVLGFEHKAWRILDAAGLPRRRDEAVAGQQQSAAHRGGAPQTTEAERGGRPCQPLPGGQLLPEKRTWPTIVARLREQGEATWCPRRTAPRRTGVGGACVGLNPDGQPTAAGWAAHQHAVGAQPAIRDLACGHRRELTENTRSNP